MNTQKKVTIESRGNAWYLFIDGKRTFIKGARTLGFEYMDLVASVGGNSVRMSSGRNLEARLDTANKYGLTVLLGLPVASERNGFDYNDSVAVENQKEKILEIVKKYKNHPAILMWALGNEMDYIPDNPDYNLRLWDAVNDLALEIKDMDPNHPVITVIGTGRKYKLRDIREKLNAIDAIGINSYGDIFEIPLLIRTYTLNKPYLITEWGPTGHWQVPRNKWGLPFEETSTEKAADYLERHQEVIEGDPHCLGGYSFLWTQNRQERTHTWYNMFYDNGEKTEAVDVMQYLWTGNWPSNRAPVIDSIKLNDQGQRDNISLTTGESCMARVYAKDPDEDPLRFEWEIYPENTEFGYAGHGEDRPPSMNDLFKNNGKQQVEFKAPAGEGDYRIFIYIRDDNSKIALGNIPFHVEK